MTYAEHLGSAYEHELPSLFPVHQRGECSVSCARASPVLRSAAPRVDDACVQFDLVEKKELAPLDELNVAILAEDKAR